ELLPVALLELREPPPLWVRGGPRVLRLPAAIGVAIEVDAGGDGAIEVGGMEEGARLGGRSGRCRRSRDSRFRRAAAGATDGEGESEREQQGGGGRALDRQGRLLEGWAGAVRAPRRGH